MTKYGPKAQKKISKVMHEFGKGKLMSGTSLKKVTSQKQAVAIGISEARKEGYKVPRQNRMIDKKSLLRKTDHLTRPPRLEGVVKNKMMNPIRKKKMSESKKESKK